MRQLRRTGYMAHLHRQCCAAFLVRDLKLDWRLGAEHFESCLVDYTPDANWGNWAYRILQRPCLALSRARTRYTEEDRKSMLSPRAGKKNKGVLSGGTNHGGVRVIDVHMSTLECLAWPLVHDCRLEHTLTWVPELKVLPKDYAREPWRLAETYKPGTRPALSVKPFKDSPLWFCAANRTNWGYEYFWLCGGAFLSDAPCTGTISGTSYPLPMVPALNLQVKLSKLPVKNHVWGDTPEPERPHITK